MTRQSLISAALAALAAAIAGCTSPPVQQEPAPVVSAPPPVAVAPAARPSDPASTGGPRLAPRDPALEQWKRLAAERIHAANSKQLFEGRPHHLLQGVIVVDLTVDRTGQVTRSKIVRSPGIAKLDSMVQASLKAASPLPAPPSSLVKNGPITYSETWLVTNDSRWRLRTLSMPQE